MQVVHLWIPTHLYNAHLHANEKVILISSKLSWSYTDFAHTPDLIPHRLLFFPLPLTRDIPSTDDSELKE